MIYERFATTILNASNVGIPVPGGGNDQTVIRSIMYPVYFWAGVVAVVVIIAAGFFYVTSSGNPQQLTRAKNAIMGAVVGLIVVLLAFSITAIVLGGL
ncbi:hypothetical protein HG445_002690 [Candidatus Saccharibacteria bacterium]|jgi:hypothetical protein|nr:hypothetical protein [Candidatus Saccharibacteria bacterium]QHU89066.1 hypothetical protein GWK73_00085 [Candidatus Saccharibacteria bacterium oral taxon 955]QHU90883.1 hypothetical protein GWK75_00085 [Candidatus Saccharibacteria bacterium oral taxon 955]